MHRNVVFNKNKSREQNIEIIIMDQMAPVFIVAHK